MSTMRADTLVNHLEGMANPEKAAGQAGFFKTGPGQYGEGDVFWGITVPQVRAGIRPWRGLPLDEVEILLWHDVHEVRMAGWMLLVDAFGRANATGRREIFRFYLAHTGCANNWDLVDLSAYHIVGEHLREKDDTRPLRKLARSACLWERRIAVVATFAFIKAGQFSLTMELCEAMLGDRHDLMHKACGWMLREMGKRGGLEELRGFLRRHHRVMPRVMLRYAIERMSAAERARWMA